jgi:3',5'-cyclic AMP phosphodiesterase CpdA
LAHLSDLHIGRSVESDARAVRLCQALVESRVDHVVVTGDVTHRGRRRELARFEETFAPLRESGRLTVIPGNHDRLGDDLGDHIMAGDRVQATVAPGLYLVRVDSTGPHNRNWLTGHGRLDEEDLDGIEAALARAPARHLAVVLMHHHPLPLPEDRAVERISSWMGWRFTHELERGQELLDRIRGRCDLLLHGHRHVPCERRPFADDLRPLRVLNAGCSTELGRACIFTHVAGQLVSEPTWLDAMSVVPEDVWPELDDAAAIGGARRSAI